MNTCSNCKFWRSPEDDQYVSVLVGRCTKAKMIWDCTEWTKDGDDGSVLKFKPEYADLMMFVQDGSDYWAELQTKPEFFCAHWTKKEAA